MRVIRAHDGVAFDFLRRHLEGVRKAEALAAVLAPGIGVAPDSLIMMTPGGSMLTDSILSHVLDSLPLSHSQDLLSTTAPDQLHTDHIDTLYAFDRQFWGVDIDKAAAHLAVGLDDLLEPPISPYDPTRHSYQDASSLASAHLKAAQSHVQSTAALLSHVRCQKAAISVALANLTKYSESTVDPWRTLEMSAGPAVEEYDALLQSYEPGMALAKRVRVLSGVMDGAIGASGASSGKVKYMGDYVSHEKISSIRDRCATVFRDLQRYLNELRETVASFEATRSNIMERLASGEGDIDDLQDLERDAEDGFMKVEDNVIHIIQPGPGGAADLVALFEELHLLDEDAKERLACLVERKNGLIRFSLETFSIIADSQSALATIPGTAQSLNRDLSGRTDNFKHLARLKDFVVAYALTVVEVVRRREFSRQLLEHSVTLAGLLTSLSTEERKRRLAFQSLHGGKMPFDIRGLEDNAVPVVEAELKTPTGARVRDIRQGADPPSLPPLTRADIDELLAILRNIEEAPTSEDLEVELARTPARATRLLVEEGVSKLEAMETAFAQAAERLILSDSDFLPPPEGKAQTSDEIERLRQRVTELESERDQLRTDLDRERHDRSDSRERRTITSRQEREELLQRFDRAEQQARQHEQSANQLQAALDAQLQRYTAQSDDLSRRITDLEAELLSSQRTLHDAERQLASARTTADQATRELRDLETRHHNHASDRSNLEWSLQQARDRVMQIEADLDAVRAERDHLSDTLQDRDRQLRDLRSETGFDMAILENEVQVVKAELVASRKAMNDVERRAETLRSQLTDAERTIARDATDKEASQSSLTDMQGKAKDAALVAEKFRLAAERTCARLAAMPPAGSSQKANGGADGGMALSSAIEEDPYIPDPSSPAFAAFVHALMQANITSYGNIVQKKADSLSLQTRKWMKESQRYRERAQKASEKGKTKLAFRHFEVGDLVLFLPTRNRTSQIWAAFNIGFPYYFLQMTPKITAQTRSMEWLVARITAMTEHMIDPKDTSSNAYLLAPGTKYYLLETDGPWSPERLSPRKTDSTPLPRSATPKSTILSATHPSKLHSPPQRRSSSFAQSGQASSSAPMPTPLASTPHGMTRISTSPTAMTASTPVPGASPTKSNLAISMVASDFTIIEQAASPINENPFLSLGSTTPPRPLPGSLALPSKNPPSGIALSLARSRTPSVVSGSPAANLKPWPSISVDVSDEVSEASFQPSESAKPAFLSTAAASIITTRSSQAASTSAKPLSHAPSLTHMKPRRRPMPRANISRPPSRSSSNSSIRPTIAALLKPTGSSPLSKGPSTVSTTLYGLGTGNRDESRPTPQVVDTTGTGAAVLSRSPTRPPDSAPAMSGSLFGSWRKRRESSYGGASDLLKRFSSKPQQK